MLPDRADVADVRLPSPLIELSDDALDQAGVRLWLKREDLIHPALPGNKWRKLKYNLGEIHRQGNPRVLTFGGAFSNHIRAVAAAGKIFGFETVGVIRGEAHHPLNPTLAFASEQGMRLVYMDRETYRRKHTPEVADQLRAQHGRFYLLPEGGSNDLAVRGCTEIVYELGTQLDRFDVVCCPVGTGGTLAGIAAGIDPPARAVGYAVLKGAKYLEDEVRRLQRQAFGTLYPRWRIEHGFHFGGFAKHTLALDDFIDTFEHCHGIRLDRVYVAKMMCGIYQMAADGGFESRSRIVAVVTGSAEY